MPTIKIDQLADAIAQELEAYEQEITDGIKEDVKEAAEACRDRIKQTAPKNKGKYARSWKVTKAYESRTDIRYAVHSRQYQLVHLLENGHAKVNGGRVAARPHVQPAAEYAEKLLDKKAEVTLKE